jgi:hypothetical protein
VKQSSTVNIIETASNLRAVSVQLLLALALAAPGAVRAQSEGASTPSSAQSDKPAPLLLNVGVRATKAAHLGLLGFTGDYRYVFEGNAVLFLTSNFALAAEYRQKPDEYRPIGSLVKAEADWLTFDAAYVINNHLTVAAGYGHFGDVLNHTANGVWGIANKFEF